MFLPNHLSFETANLIENNFQYTFDELDGKHSETEGDVSFCTETDETLSWLLDETESENVLDTLLYLLQDSDLPTAAQDVLDIKEFNKQIRDNLVVKTETKHVFEYDGVKL